MSQSPLATAADYADALLTARRARNWLFAILLLMLLIQLATFFVVRYKESAPATESQVLTPAAQPAARSADAPASGVEDLHPRLRQWLAYATGMINFLGIALVLVLAMDLLLIIQIMLVGRLIGVSHLIAAFIGCLLLTVLLFPWQAFLDNYAFKIPGVLYTWDELAHRARFTHENLSVAVLSWARFVGFPVIAVILLLWVHTRSRRGLRMALGEVEPPASPAASA
jgi:hypothetical protein